MSEMKDNVVVIRYDAAADSFDVAYTGDMRATLADLNTAIAKVLMDSITKREVTPSTAAKIVINAARHNAELFDTMALFEFDDGEEVEE